MGKSITKVLKATALAVIGTIVFFSIDKIINIKSLIPELQFVVYGFIFFGIIVFFNQLHKILNED
jgi:hypothetical protein